MYYEFIFTHWELEKDLREVKVYFSTKSAHFLKNLAILI